MVDIPEELLRRSAAARAAATGVPVDEVLAEMRAAVGSTASAPRVEDAPTDGEPEHPTTLSDDLLTREAAARARVLGVPEADAVAELKGEKELVIPPSAKKQEEKAPAESQAPVEALVENEPPSAPVADTPAVPLLGAGGEIDYAAAALAVGMPEALLKRSVEAKAKARGLDPVAVLAEMTGGSVETVVEPVAVAMEPASEAAPPTPAPTVAGPAGELDWAAAASAAGMPEKLFRRSVEAKA
ncbi:MAG: hypothetical protein P1T08_11670, partial [Acidimicrobiia bacterium]|nr:hypothetical protein [Acidimicrobiia bacterium]